MHDLAALAAARDWAERHQLDQPDVAPAVRWLADRVDELAAERDAARRQRDDYARSRNRFADLLLATAAALHMPGGAPVDAIPARAAEQYDTRLHTQLNAAENDLRSQTRAFRDLTAERDQARAELDAVRLVIDAARHWHAVRADRTTLGGTYSRACQALADAVAAVPPSLGSPPARAQDPHCPVHVVPLPGCSGCRPGRIEREIARAQEPTALCILGPTREPATITGDIATPRVLAALEQLGWPDDRGGSAHVEPDGWELTGAGHYYALAEDTIRAADEAAASLTRRCAHPGCPRTYRADVGPQDRGWVRLRDLAVLWLCPDHAAHAAAPAESAVEPPARPAEGHRDSDSVTEAHGGAETVVGCCYLCQMGDPHDVHQTAAQWFGLPGHDPDAARLAAAEQAEG